MIKANDRVVLINPGGYSNYQGTVERIFKWGIGPWWADIKWDMPHHPCTTPMEIKHLKQIVTITGTDKIYLSSDSHVGHRKIIELDNAPFSTIEERDAFIFEENRKVLVSGTTLYHLGDVAWYNRSLPPYLDSIKGKVILIRGNHDDKVAWESDGFAEKHESIYLEIATCNTGLAITNEDGTPVKTIKLHLSHYPIVEGEWRNQKRGSFHLFGHVHGRRYAVTEGRAMDVGVHPNEYKPVPLSTVLRTLWDRWAEPIE